MHDATDVITIAEHFDGLHRFRIDPIDNRAAVRAVLGHRHPDVAAVVVDATRVIDGTLTERDVSDEAALRVELEQMPDALSSIAIVTALRLGKALGRCFDLDR